MQDKGLNRIFACCGREWRICGADMNKLWEAMGKDDGDDRIPYWNEVWPSSLAMAGWLAESRDDIKGRRCLDLGCGLGFTALVGRWLGADVVGGDYEEAALLYAQKNEKINEISGIQWEQMDWRQAVAQKGSFERIWASDVMYEKESARPLAVFLSSALRKGGRAWIAEPGRSIFKAFIDVLPACGMQIRRICSLPVFPLIEQPASVPVSLWEIFFSV